MLYILEMLVVIGGAFIGGWVTYKWWETKRYRSAADKFKEILVSDLPNFESAETNLSAIVLSQYPKHNEAFRKFLIYVPRNKISSFRAQWKVYEEIYTPFSSIGETCGDMAELPKQDIELNLEIVDSISLERKQQIAKLMKEFIEKL